MRVCTLQALGMGMGFNRHDHIDARIERIRVARQVTDISTAERSRKGDLKIFIWISRSV